MLANLQLKLKKPRPAKAVPRRYDVEKLTGRNDLLDLDPEDVETMYDGFKEATNNTHRERSALKEERK